MKKQLNRFNAWARVAEQPPRGPFLRAEPPDKEKCTVVNYQSSRQVAEEIGLRPSTLLRAVWDGRIPQPPKNQAGDFCWRRVDVRRAAAVFKARGVKAGTAAAVA